MFDFVACRFGAFGEELSRGIIALNSIGFWGCLLEGLVCKEDMEVDGLIDRGFSVYFLVLSRWVRIQVNCWFVQ